MSKSSVTWLFAGAFVTVVFGSVLALVAVVTGIAGGAVTISGEIITLNGGSVAGTRWSGWPSHPS